MKQPVSITVHTLVHAPLPMVWQYWTEPQHIKNWNSASPDWETTQATSDLTAGGRFSYAMQAKDGSTGFAFSGTFVEVTPTAVTCLSAGRRATGARHLCRTGHRNSADRNL